MGLLLGGTEIADGQRVDVDRLEILDTALLKTCPVVRVGFEERRDLLKLLGHDPGLDARFVAPRLEGALAQRDHGLIGLAGIAIEHDGKGLARHFGAGGEIRDEGLGRFPQGHLLEQHTCTQIRLAP